MKVTSSVMDSYVLRKFLKVARLAQTTATDLPIWSSIIFEAENQRILYLGWKFSVELEYPVEEDFVVNFSRFREAIRSCTRPNIRTTKYYVMVEEDGVKFKLKKLDLDYSNFIPNVPKDLQYKEAKDNLLNDIKFCSIASSTDRYDYKKFGVILGNEMMCAMDSESAISTIFLEEPIFTQPILLQLPWCEILQDFGDITSIAEQDVGQQNSMLYITTRDGFKVILPALKVNPNPSISSYLETIEPHVTLSNMDKNLLKKLEVTCDDAYKFATIFSEDGDIYMETRSKTKGRTVVNICEGTLGGISVTISLDFLKNVISLADYLYLDLDNHVGFIREDDRMYAFSLG